MLQAMLIQVVCLFVGLGNKCLYLLLDMIAVRFFGGSTVTVSKIISSHKWHTFS